MEMDDDVNQQPAVAEESAVPSDKNKSGTAATASRRHRGILSRVWNGIFRKGNEDFEKKLQHLTKEEASIHARMKKRTQRWRKTARNLIVFSVGLEQPFFLAWFWIFLDIMKSMFALLIHEGISGTIDLMVIAVAYAIMTTRAVTLNWKMRAARVLPMFALPALSSLIYLTLESYTRMRDRKDQKSLERLRAERQAKIDELKERTNYYITQQLIQVGYGFHATEFNLLDSGGRVECWKYLPFMLLSSIVLLAVVFVCVANLMHVLQFASICLHGFHTILTTNGTVQRYDPDPAAKAAAASVLASKLGAESGLKIHLGEESYANTSVGRSSDVELVQSRGLRNRKQSLSQTSSTASSEMQQLVEETTGHSGVGYDNPAVVVEHHSKSANNDGGWVARIAALLVGEDPTQCYALICGNCHMHNGLARKEDFPFITYYCPHCHALNGSQQVVAEHGSGSNSGKPRSPVSASIDSNRTTIASGATSESAVPDTAAKGNELQDSSAPIELDSIYIVCE
ncbi:hypothetical protein ACLOJK_003390 [Asimina triloba]